MLEVPKGDAATPRPLVVVLHGDEGSPARLFATWKGPAAQAGFVLLAPKCPRAKGCRGSWWKWRGDPSWVIEQAEAVTKELPIDPARRYLAGWSGGATYLTLNLPRWTPPFSALSIAGGGASPDDPLVCPPCRPAVFYIQGDANPLYWLAKYAHDYLVRCDYPLTWKLLPGADHASEHAIYSDPATIRSILSWMQAHAGACATPADETAAQGAAPPSAQAEPKRASAAVPPPQPSALATPPRAAPPQPAAPSHCACGFVGASSKRSDPLLWLGATLLVGARRRWARRSMRDGVTAATKR